MWLMALVCVTTALVRAWFSSHLRCSLLETWWAIFLCEITFSFLSLSSPSPLSTPCRSRPEPTRSFRSVCPAKVHQTYYSVQCTKATEHGEDWSRMALEIYRYEAKFAIILPLTDLELWQPFICEFYRLGALIYNLFHALRNNWNLQMDLNYFFSSVAEYFKVFIS